MVKKLFKKEKIDEKDVGLIEDALYTLRNLVAWEDHITRHIEHLKKDSDKEKFINMYNRIRERRSLLMDLIVTKNPKHSEWCQTKHASNSSMGFIELASRFSYMGDVKKALRCFKESKECENDIFSINNINPNQKEFISDA